MLKTRIIIDFRGALTEPDREVIYQTLRKLSSEENMPCEMVRSLEKQLYSIDELCNPDKKIAYNKFMGNLGALTISQNTDAFEKMCRDHKYFFNKDFELCL